MDSMNISDYPFKKTTVRACQLTLGVNCNKLSGLVLFSFLVYSANLMIHSNYSTVNDVNMLEKGENDF